MDSEFNLQKLEMQKGLALASCAHARKKVLYVNLWKSRTASIWHNLLHQRLFWTIMYAKYSVPLHLERSHRWKLGITRLDSARRKMCLTGIWRFNHLNLQNGNKNSINANQTKINTFCRHCFWKSQWTYMFFGYRITIFHKWLFSSSLKIIHL